MAAGIRTLLVGDPRVADCAHREWSIPGHLERRPTLSLNRIVARIGNGSKIASGAHVEPLREIADDLRISNV